MASVTKILIKPEIVDNDLSPRRKKPRVDPEFTGTSSIIDLSSSDSESDTDSSSSDDDNPTANGNNSAKRKSKRAAGDLGAVLPVGFLDPLPSKQQATLPLPWPEGEQSCLPLPSARVNPSAESSVKQFWKAGDYEGVPGGDWGASSGGMDHVRVHPKFLHSNATSHKWVLGAFAELLDNALDEVRNGATYVNIDMVKNKKDGNKMLLIEDNGGGMDPDKMRHCMSLGYSAKSKLADTIGQYGNGFKTSTMRLGADVIVFSRSHGMNRKRPTQSIGLLSYTFLRSTGKEDIVVPMLDYERREQDWIRFVRSSATDWKHNVETVVQWSPFSSEAELLQQFNQMHDQGTRIFIYNLWEDDQGMLELDFDTDPHDIQIRGVNRDEKSIDMAKRCPNSKHFLTYRHSLRSYAAILYLRIPPSFRIILRGEDVEHHNIVNDMMMSQEITYRPQPGIDGIPKDSNMVAVVTVGFVKDAKAHVDVQGFNVYHKNRLIKPFWRVWHPPGSDGRGVIGVLEANFIEPAHDKQGFERTTILSRLETRLIQMQRTYWTTNCHKIGYAPRHNRKVNEREAIPDFPTPQFNKKHSATCGKTLGKFMEKGNSNGHLNGKSDARMLRKHPNYAELCSSSPEVISDDEQQNSTIRRQASGLSSRQVFEKDKSRCTLGLRSLDAVHSDSPTHKPARTPRSLASQGSGFDCNGNSPSSSKSHALALLKEEDLQLRERLERKEEILGELQHDLQREKERCKSLEAELLEAKQKNEELKKDQETLIDIFTEERQRRDDKEENLRIQLKDASNTIQQLLDKVRLLEKLPSREIG